jgi:hypothetical protein
MVVMIDLIVWSDIMLIESSVGKKYSDVRFGGCVNCETLVKGSNSALEDAVPRAETDTLQTRRAMTKGR